MNDIIAQQIADTLRNIANSLNTIAQNTSDYGSLANALRSRPGEVPNPALYEIARHLGKFTEEADIVKIIKKRPEQKNNRSQKQQVTTKDADPLEIFKYMYPKY